MAVGLPVGFSSVVEYALRYPSDHGLLPVSQQMAVGLPVGFSSVVEYALRYTSDHGLLPVSLRMCIACSRVGSRCLDRN